MESWLRDLDTELAERWSLLNGEEPHESQPLSQGEGGTPFLSPSSTGRREEGSAMKALWTSPSIPAPEPTDGPSQRRDHTSVPSAKSLHLGAPKSPGTSQCSVVAVTAPKHQPHARPCAKLVNLQNHREECRGSRRAASTRIPLTHTFHGCRLSK